MVALGKEERSHMTSSAAEGTMIIIDTFGFFHNDQISEEIIKMKGTQVTILPRINSGERPYVV